ncbi:hypothetical protein BKP45_01050 [Anaerobacillus alkalidiazotrophicus]|uniref:DUF421 domain-containing protein n=1 Tax=Anaerobacillus alkalidiazotrophicus TaxID=472963 RepID=A0A1S2M9I5_9BACI|nr:DUF421 domain-containing protein [Anaerobacillus alkalidiazotrophicus]OIJ21398.1 hypothetical protein BKP45_01050 [Anaerobacillus alkalidiazotrophicus]
MNTNIFHLSIELFVGFLALLIITKVLGKTQITQITPFDFISALVLGELVGNAIYDKDISVWYVLYAITLWGMLIYAVELLTQKFKGTRKILEGKPAIVIRNGKLDRDELKKNKLDINQLQHLLRDKDVFSIREVEFAILEANGSVNVLKKSNYVTPTRKDLNITPQQVNLPISIILDGEVLWDNLSEAGFNEIWLNRQLSYHGITNPEQVLFAEWLEGEPLFVTSYHL